jgi:hypothetical protein
MPRIEVKMLSSVSSVSSVEALTDDTDDQSRSFNPEDAFA